jgi:hypothetical protein
MRLRWDKLNANFVDTAKNAQQRGGTGGILHIVSVKTQLLARYIDLLNRSIGIKRYRCSVPIHRVGQAVWRKSLGKGVGLGTRLEKSEGKLGS